MRNKLWNRILVALSGLLLLVSGAFATLTAFLALFGIQFSLGGVELSSLLEGWRLWQRVLGVAGGLLLCFLGLHNLLLPFPRRRERGFIMQRTELGDMSISMNALDTMTRKCVGQHQEISVKSTRIFRVKNGIAIEIRITLAAGVNIPLTVKALQKQVKQYIVSCSGVEVKEIKVLVETSVPAAESRLHAFRDKKDLVLDARKSADPADHLAAETKPEPVFVPESVPVADNAPETAEPVWEAPAPEEEESLPEEAPLPETDEEPLPPQEEENGREEEAAESDLTFEVGEEEEE